MGADLAIDPREMSPYEPIAGLGGRQVNLVYENVGLPGMLQQIISAVRFDSDDVELFISAHKSGRVQRWTA